MRLVDGKREVRVQFVCRPATDLRIGRAIDDGDFGGIRYVDEYAGSVLRQLKAFRVTRQAY